MKKLKTMTEWGLIAYAMEGIEARMDALQDVIRAKEDSGKDFHKEQDQWYNLEKQYNELLNRRNSI